LRTFKILNSNNCDTTWPSRWPSG